VAQASFEAWTRYYRPDENTLNSTVSYYTKGSLVALCLDLTLRQEGQGNLDQVMRLLWQTSKGGPITEGDIATALQTIGGRSFQSELKQWVHGTKELPVAELLALQGVKLRTEPASIDHRLGLKAQEDRGLRISHVVAGSVAERAGFAPGDEWLGLEVGKGAQVSAWRVHKWSDLGLLALPNTPVVALIARDKRLLRLTLRLPPNGPTAHPADKVILGVAEPLLLRSWLAPAND
jgi:predicted metalloprotease with PDZ domain